jgi:hypothetical protein
MSDETVAPRAERGPVGGGRRPLVRWMLALTLLASGAQAGAQSPDSVRGRTLYDARCDTCHDRGVHQRASRTAKDFAALRASVQRWDRELGAAWRAEEIDAVTRYLNERYYRYPCPTTVCRAERVEAGTGMVQSAR